MTTALGERPVGLGGLRLAFGKVGPIVFLGIAPLVLIFGVIVYSLVEMNIHNAFWDFHAFWSAGRDVIHGRSPYPPPSARVLAHEGSFVYPAPAAVAMVPFALLPFTVSAILFALLLIAALPLALRIVGVRDWRCYGLAIASAPMWNSVAVDTVSPLLAVGLALVWRYRDRTLPGAAAVAAVIVLKLFLWPLLLWLAFTRRSRTALLAVGLMLVVTFVGWALIGFDGLRSYEHVLQLLTKLLEGKGYSLVALGLSLGATTAVARALPFVVGGAALALIALRGRRPGADEWSFAVATGAALALSPIVWLHYFVLVFVPIAIVRPRLSWLWAMPLLLWVVGGQSISRPIWDSQKKYRDLATSPRVGHASLIVYALAVVTAILATAAYAARSARRQA